MPECEKSQQSRVPNRTLPLEINRVKRLIIGALKVGIVASIFPRGTRAGRAATNLVVVKANQTDQQR